MFKAIWNFLTIQLIMSSLLLASSMAMTPEEAMRAAAEQQRLADLATIQATGTVNQTTGVSKDALISGDVHQVTQEQINMANGNVPKAGQVSAEAQRLLDVAKNNLDEKKLALAEAQSGLNKADIQKKEAALAAAQAACPNYSANQDFGSSCPNSQSQNAINTAAADLQKAKIPNYDYNLIQKAKNELSEAEKSFTAAQHEAQYGLQTVAGAEALKKAAQEIDTSITDEFKKDAAGNTKAGGIMDLIKKSTTANTLQAQYKNLGDYNSQLQQDIVMLIIGQVTQRLNACKQAGNPNSQAPDIRIGIGAGQAFIVGEVAEYVQAEFLKGKLTDAIKNQDNNPLNKQLDVFRTLRTEYTQVLQSALTKQKFRNLSSTAFRNAAALAAAEAVEDETWAVSCENENTNKVSRGSNQGSDMMIYFAGLAAMYYSYPYCAGCAAAVAMLLLKKAADEDKNSCESGGRATAQKITDRKIACDALGTEAMFTPAAAPTITASKTITDACLQNGSIVEAGAGQGCSGYASNGAGPYSACGKATETFGRNMAACPVSVLQAAKVSTLETSGIASAEGREFVRVASEKVSRTVDMRMASPRQRIIVWSAFGELADVSVDTNKAMIQKIQGQLDKIQKIIDSLEGYKNGVMLAKTTTPTGLSSTGVKIDQTELKMVNPTICLNGTSDACKLTVDALNDGGSLNNFSLDLQAATKKVSSGLDAFSNKSKLSSEDISKVDNASLATGAINSALAKKMKMLSSLSNSKNKSDFSNDSKLFANMLNKSIGSEIKKSNFKVKPGSLASIEPVANAKNDNSENADKADSNLSKLGSTNYSSTSNQGALPSSNSTKSSTTKADSAAVTSEGDTSASGLMNDDRTKLAEAIEARNKANKDKYASKDDQTIFEKVTNAYVRNYDKILTKKKVSDPSTDNNP